MLFLLTAPRQAGKTRWLERLLGDLGAAGVTCWGVVAPGVWEERPDGSLEKRGIDNLLLPSGRRLSFALRRDLAQAAGAFCPSSESAAANLGWEISDDALRQVNACFANLRGAGAGADVRRGRGGLLVVDELGPLELLRGGGLAEAVAAVADGPLSGGEHALVVVRPELVDLAEERFARAWDGVARIAPDDEGRLAVMRALGAASR
ncbi:MULTISPECIES: hypothetical protein [unclassified Adlercreutzia]|uniref:hypothetical protein n=1 Tax=unclassified Adlercreutzia TaxID=2636013 RepID=UPI0013EB5F40|nr:MULTISPECIES: hypothetical protein [unclassified Adlercreutzia]